MPIVNATIGRGFERGLLLRQYRRQLGQLRLLSAAVGPGVDCQRPATEERQMLGGGYLVG